MDLPSMNEVGDLTSVVGKELKEKAEGLFGTAVGFFLLVYPKDETFGVTYSTNLSSATLPAVLEELAGNIRRDRVTKLGRNVCH